MTLDEAMKRIEELERRVKELEARPEHVHHHYPPPHPVPLIGHPSWPARLEPWCLTASAAGVLGAEPD